ncbi:TPM domain-containing protein [Ferruginibacter yonginensis]|uniref:TPM domain-containing protein n=1 Tax=Ferruginibacter yonginensis TaxID=1310416 RepID=A0ABV8QV99_9BACT
MKHIKYIILFWTFILTAVFAIAQTLPDRPNPPKLVNDFTNTLTTEQIQSLEAKLVRVDDSTSTQIAVVIIPTLNGATIADYNVELMRKWGVGSKQNNNGVILLIAKNDRKLDITVGYGLEGALTDAVASDIINNIIVPNFKGNDYYRGVDAGTDAIVKAVKGEYKVARVKKGKGGSNIFFIIFIIIIIISILSGGRGNSGGSVIRNSGVADVLFWNALLNSGGRGGGGGGGFGGFGGGSGGGGGASGSW